MPGSEHGVHWSLILTCDRGAAHFRLLGSRMGILTNRLVLLVSANPCGLLGEPFELEQLHPRAVLRRFSGLQARWSRLEAGEEFRVVDPSVVVQVCPPRSVRDVARKFSERSCEVLDGRRNYARPDRRPLHDRFHDLGEPRRGMRRHHDLLYQDV